MHDAAVISGSLVDAKNVNTHKVMRLIIDVPAENALKVIAAFGWPTMVNPVSVAVARLAPEAANRKDGEVHQTGSVSEREQPGRNNTTPRPSVVPASAAGADNLDIPPELDRRKKSPAQIAGYLCTQLAFRKFLQEKFSNEWLRCIDRVDDPYAAIAQTKTAAAVVREICKVNSRADLTDKNIKWNALLLAFRLWENHPELEDA